VGAKSKFAANGCDINSLNEPGTKTRAGQYNPSTGAILYWVKIPTVSHTADTVFYLFYGNSSVSTDQSNKTAVWDGNYVGVWHLSDNAANTTVTDSTINDSNGTAVANTNSKSVAGEIGSALSFNGSTDEVTTSLTRSSSFTWEAWINQSTQSGYQSIITVDGSNYVLMDLTGGNASFWTADGLGGNTLSVTGLSAGTWNHLVFVRSGDNLATGYSAYLNGALSGQASSGSLNIGNPITFGFRPDSPSQGWNGKLDEIRISNTARSADWIAIEYNNQHLPSTFAIVGSPAQGPSSLTINRLLPTSASQGDLVSLQGANFGSTQGTVTFNGISVSIQTWNDTSIGVIVPNGGISGPFSVTVNGVTVVSSTLTVKSIPSGWSDEDIGTVGIAGSAAYASGTFTVQGAGQQIYGSADAFHFVYRALSGDGTIVARVVSMQGGASYASAGVMVRETLDSGSANAKTSDWPAYGGIYFDLRAGTGGGTSEPGGVSVSFPYWVKVVRSGSTFSSFTSSDGATWTQLSSGQTINMAQTVYAGLAVNSGSTSSLTTATFDNVSVSSNTDPAPMINGLYPSVGIVGSQVAIYGSGFGATQGNSIVYLNGSPLTVNSWSAASITITIPAGATSGPIGVSVAPTMNDSNVVTFLMASQPLSGWRDIDIGPVGVTGSATYLNGVFVVQGAGEIGSNGNSSWDAFHFVYQQLSGDGTIVARVTSEQGGGYPQVGVMMRETLSANATSAMLYYQPNTSWLVYRPSTGSNATAQMGNGQENNAGAYWVELSRTGNSFSSAVSMDGVIWVQAAAPLTMSMASTIYVGLAVSGAGVNTLETGTIDGVSVSSNVLVPPVITSLSATTASVGSPITIYGSGFGSSQGSSAVILNGSRVPITSWCPSTIGITIPAGATSGLLEVLVGPSMDSSNPVAFAVTSSPLPAGWFDTDIGSASNVIGNASYSGGTFTVNGSGNGLIQNADSFHFAYRVMAGDGVILARVTSIPSGGTGGLVMRESLGAGSTGVFAGFFNYYYTDVSLNWRGATGGGSAMAGNTYGVVWNLPQWLKVVRSGNVLSAYTSADGVTWNLVVTSVTISMAQTIYVGFGSAYGSPYSLGTTTFDNVSVTQGTMPVISGVSPSSGGRESSVTITGTGFGQVQGTNALNFNGTPATSITSWNDSQVVANVPNAATTGPVTVVVNLVESNTNWTYTVFNPVIGSLTPAVGQVGATVTVAGSGFGGSQGDSQVSFNGTVANVNSWSDTSISVTVPSAAITGPVTVTVGGVVGNGMQFAVEPLSVTGISSSIGQAGNLITITGTGFGNTPSNGTVDFNGTVAPLQSWSDTQIVAMVPAGASTGSVNVTVGSVTWYGPQFTLTQTNQIADSLGNQSSYTSGMIGGMWVSVVGQGSGCSTCTQRGNISYTYDSFGHPLSRTDENGHITNYTYDAHGNVLSVAVPINLSTYAITTYTYNTFGEVLTATDPLGNVTASAYDGNGNLLSVTTPAPGNGASASVTQFAYNSLGELISITDPLNNTTSITYTPVGLMATITDAQSNVTTYAYDSNGNRTSVTDALQHQTTFTYDAMNRLTKITYPDTTYTQFGYDSRGRRTSVTDQNQKTTTYAYDDADRLTTVTDAANNVTTYGYDTESNLTSIKDANQNTTNFSYDAFGRVTQTSFPSGYVETYGYDNVGNLTSKTDRKNQLITYTYDQLNRLTQKAYPDTSTVNYTYDNDSRLTQVTDPTGTYQFMFDNMGRLTGTSTQYAFLTSRSFTTSYGYDAASNRISFTDPENGTSSYVYDTLNRLQTLTPPTAISSGNFGFAYDALSRRTSLTRPNTVNTSYGYDNLSRLLSVTHAKGGVTLDGASYTVDNAGNRTAKSDLYAGVTTNYGYDAIYELLNATQAGATTESYTYDPVGNRLSNLTSSGWSYNTSNELNSRPAVSYAYDANGNTTSKTDSTGTTNYSWDFENRLTQVTLPGSGGTVSFKYDPFGRRIYKSSSSGTSIFTYDNDNLIEETNSAGSAVARYSQGLNIDEPLAMLRSGVTSYYEVDGLSSTTSLSNGAGALAQTYMFDSFGNLTASTGSLTNPFRYTARDFDSETGLQFSRARYYDPQAGRFISEDPMRFDAGINFYRYVKNNATNLADPFGLKVQKCCRTTQINWWADFISMLAGLKHCFIKTDKVTAGMGPANGGALPACPYNTPTKITDQSADAVSPGDCKDVPGVDETCVNNALHIGTPTGKWTVSNQCNSLVNGILEKCSTCTKNSSGFDPLTYGFATH